MHSTEFEDLGLIEFGRAWDIQISKFDSVLRHKKENTHSDKTQHLLFCEHSHVYTLGKSGNESNLLIDTQQLQKRGAALFHIDRGGDITYHGPGQLVAYPIFDLQEMKIGVKEYVHRLEQVVIETLKDYGIEAGRLNGATGVWLDAESKNARKICAIGVRVSRFVTMHGFAFNINTDLNYFNYINPCGFIDKGVTSLQKELGYELNMNEIKQKVREKFKTLFDLNYV